LVYQAHININLMKCMHRVPVVNILLDLGTFCISWHWIGQADGKKQRLHHNACLPVKWPSRYLSDTWGMKSTFDSVYDRWAKWLRPFFWSQG
jgi:hypothetical protein